MLAAWMRTVKAYEKSKGLEQGKEDWGRIPINDEEDDDADQN